MALIWSACFAKSVVPATFTSLSVEGGDAAQDSNKHQLKGAGSISIFSDFQSKTRVVLNLTDV